MKTERIEQYEFICEALANKKGLDITAIDLGNAAAVSDIFILVTANSETHMRTLLEAADEALIKYGIKHPRIEGENSPHWRLVDGDNVFVHIFSRKGREHYKIEKVWGDAEIVNYGEPYDITVS
ncbi:MAG: ribosome silencing factor [Synergistaceae bacterium]|nr:ribosome silencing factor [Synergistaceae bacterium]